MDLEKIIREDNLGLFKQVLNENKKILKQSLVLKILQFSYLV